MNKTKVKIISGGLTFYNGDETLESSSKNLELGINKFLNKKKITVIDIKYQVTYTDSGTIHDAMIIYK